VVIDSVASLIVAACGSDAFRRAPRPLAKVDPALWPIKLDREVLQRAGGGSTA
jgi:hypothetical protein